MRRLFLHVGPHKTGTTSIQGSLFNARSHLAEQGILYPDSIPGARYPKSHNDVAALVDHGEYERAESYFAELADGSSAIHSIILSGERFSKLFVSGAYDWMDDLLRRNFELLPIYVQRRPETLLASLAVNWVATIPDHMIRYNSLDEYVARMVAFNEKQEAYFRERGATFVPFEELPSSTFVASFFRPVFGFELEGLSEDQLNASEGHSLDESLIGAPGARILEFFEIEDQFPLESRDGDEPDPSLPRLIRRAIQDQTRTRTANYLRTREESPIEA